MKHDILPPLTEKDFRATVRQVAKDLGWWCSYTWTSIHSPQGLPDLILIRERVIWAELKTEKGKLSPYQEEVMSLLRAAGQEVYLWRPSMISEIAETLARRA